MSIHRIFVLSTTILIATGCSSEDNSHEEAENDAGVFQGYKDSLDKAKSVEQTLMQADQSRKKLIDEN